MAIFEQVMIHSSNPPTVVQCFYSVMCSGVSDIPPWNFSGIHYFPYKWAEIIGIIFYQLITKVMYKFY